MSQAAARAEPEALEVCLRAAARIADALPLSRDTLAAILEAEPDAVPVIAAAADLSQERFKTWLKANFGTAGWVTLARERPAELVAALDESLDVVAALQTQAEREWTWADVLARTMAPRQRAGRSVQQGRDLEGRRRGDDHRAGIALGRTRAIRGDGGPARRLRDPGHGWLRRESDLRRIHELWRTGEIDGLYGRANLAAFSAALADAARRHGLPQGDAAVVVS